MTAPTARPEDMRAAMADFVAAAHEAYLSQARLLPPAERARLPLVAAGSFTVVAAGARNLHVLGTVEALPAPRGQEVALPGEAEDIVWDLRFYDPVVLPDLGLIDESAAAQPEEVRRVLGVRTVLYHLVVQPGASLTAHHAVHMGTGLANSHAAVARNLDAVRAHAPQAADLVDELGGALQAGLPRAAALLAAAIAPGDAAVGELARGAAPDPAAVLTALVAATQKEPSRAGG
ncbi:MAG: hypothetical protein M3O55_11785 [Actinomycetota bacterium]|nr:hypothetical protein [Actinomycetota bacterium]